MSSSTIDSWPSVSCFSSTSNALAQSSKTFGQKSPSKYGICDTLLMPLSTASFIISCTSASTSCTMLCLYNTNVLTALTTYNYHVIYLLVITAWSNPCPPIDARASTARSPVLLTPSDTNKTEFRTWTLLIGGLCMNWRSNLSFCCSDNPSALTTTSHSCVNIVGDLINTSMTLMLTTHYSQCKSHKQHTPCSQRWPSPAEPCLASSGTSPEDASV